MTLQLATVDSFASSSSSPEAFVASLQLSVLLSAIISLFRPLFLFLPSFFARFRFSDCFNAVRGLVQPPPLEFRRQPLFSISSSALAATLCLGSQATFLQPSTGNQRRLSLLLLLLLLLRFFFTPIASLLEGFVSVLSLRGMF